MSAAQAPECSEKQEAPRIETMEEPQNALSAKTPAERQDVPIMEASAAQEELIRSAAALDARVFPDSVWGEDAFLQNAKNSYDHLFVLTEVKTRLGGSESASLDADFLTVPETAESAPEGADRPAAAEEKQVLGFGLLRVLDMAEILLIAVEPSVRGQGFGARLLEKMLFCAKENGAQEVLLEVRAGNAPAVGLYGGKGFEIIDSRKQYYKNPPEDALIMRKRF